jgi:hypothetical protein
MAGGRPKVIEATLIVDCCPSLGRFGKFAASVFYISPRMSGLCLLAGARGRSRARVPECSRCFLILSCGAADVSEVSQRCRIWTPPTNPSLGARVVIFIPKGLLLMLCEAYLGTIQQDLHRLVELITLFRGVNDARIGQSSGAATVFD